ncbi:MAG: hypothetical protein RQ867_00645 [Mariprofundaceae bacterium]|nr:hypothetical protein [Mariprofundaceae bacterium]
MNRAVLKKDFRLSAYLLISLALAVPVVFWPLSLFVGTAPAVAGTIEKSWLIAACLLLLAAAISDSLLAGVASLRQMLLHTIWIFITVAVVSLVLRESEGAYLLGIMFSLHALRSAAPLWRHDSGWWLWPAWLRDTGMALSIFFWLALWPG